MATINIENLSNRLLFSGILLFLLGLSVGLFIPIMANPRMGLSAHLEAIMNGLFLVVLGLIWHRLKLTERWNNVAFGLVIYGTFANFIAVLTGALTGFGKLMPLAGGKEGSAIIETVISFLLISLSIAMLAVCIIVLTGLYRNMYSKNTIK